MTQVDARLSSDRTIVVVNTSDEVVALLCIRLEEEGYRTVGVPVAALKARQPVVYDLLYDHDPKVIVWDIGVPYDANWAFLQRVRASVAALGRAFIVTTFNKRALERVVGVVEALEIVSLPDDLAAVARVVTAAMAASAAPDQPIAR